MGVLRRQYCDRAMERCAHFAMSDNFFGISFGSRLPVTSICFRETHNLRVTRAGAEIDSVAANQQNAESVKRC